MADRYVIEILLEAKSQIDKAFQSAATANERLKKSFKETEKGATSLDGRLRSLDTNVQKVRDSFKATNTQAEKTPDILKKINSAGRQASGGLDKLGDSLKGINKITEGLERKLAKVEKKMVDLGAVQATPKVKVEVVNEDAIDKLLIKAEKLAAQKFNAKVSVTGREVAERELDRVLEKADRLGALDAAIDVVARVEGEGDLDRLERRLRELAAERSTVTIKADAKQVQQEIREVQAEMDRLGVGGRASEILIQANAEDAKRAIEEIQAKKQKLSDERIQIHAEARQADREIDRLSTKLAAATRKTYTFKTNVEKSQAQSAINDIIADMEKMGAGKRARQIKFEVSRESAAKVKAAQDKMVRDAAEVERRSQASVLGQRGAEIANTPTFNTSRIRDFKGFNKDYKKIRAQLFELAGIDVSPSVDLSKKKFAAEYAEVRAKLMKLGLERKTVDIYLNVKDQGVSQNFANLNKQIRDIRREGSSLATVLLNTVIGSAILAMPQLINAVTALGGALVAVASAAGSAGAALAGMAAAGAAQVGPIAGLFLLATQGASKVGDALKAQTAEQDKATKNDEDTSRRRATAGHRLRDANEAVGKSIRAVGDAQRKVADSHRNLTDAQTKLTQARREGVRTLEDLTAAELAAEMAAKRSSLAYTTSKYDLSKAIGSGSGLIQSDQLDVEDADLGRRTASRDLERARVDNTRAQMNGVEGLPDVQSARRGVEDAKRGIQDANRDLADARRGVRDAKEDVAQAADGFDDAVGKTSAAEDKLATALSKLSPAQRRLYDTIQALKKEFGGPNGLLNQISDPLVDGMAIGLNNLADILRDPQVTDALKSLSGEVRDQMVNLSEFLSSGPMRKAIADFTKEAENNLPVVETIIERLISIFVNFSKAAQDTFGRALDDLSQWLGEIDARMSSIEGQDALSGVFDRGYESLKSFLGLAGAFGSMMAALSGAGGREAGVSGIDRLTESIRRGTDNIENNQKKVHDFFKDAIDGSAAILRLIFKIGQSMVENFNVDQLEHFANFLGDVLLPIMSNLMKITGFFMDVITRLFDIPVVGSATKWIIVLGLLFVGIKRVGLMFAQGATSIASSLTKMDAKFKGTAANATAAATAMERMARAAGMTGMSTPLSMAGRRGMGATGAPAPLGAAGATSPLVLNGARPPVPPAAGGRLARLGGALRGGGGMAALGALGAVGLVGTAASAHDTKASTIGAGALSGVGAGAMFGLPGMVVGGILGGVTTGIIGALRGRKADDEKKKVQRAARLFARDQATATQNAINSGFTEGLSNSIGRLNARGGQLDRQQQDEKKNLKGLLGDRNNIQRDIDAARANPQSPFSASTIANGTTKLEALNKKIDESRRKIGDLGDSARAAAREQGRLAGAGWQGQPGKFRDASGLIDQYNQQTSRPGMDRNERREIANQLTSTATRALQTGKLSTDEYKKFVREVQGEFVKGLDGKGAMRRFISDQRAALRGSDLTRQASKVARSVQQEFGDIPKGVRTSLGKSTESTLTQIQYLQHKIKTGTREEREAAERELPKLNESYNKQIRALRKSSDPELRAVADRLTAARTEIRRLIRAGKDPIVITVSADISAESIRKTKDKIREAFQDKRKDLRRDRKNSPLAPTGPDDYKLPWDRSASGSRIGGSSAAGDSVPVLVKPGEVILNSIQQQKIGPSRINSALDSTGAPTITGGKGYATGGGRSSGASGEMNFDDQSRIWKDYVNVVRRSATAIEDRIDMMRRRAVRSITSLNDQSESRLKSMVSTSNRMTNRFAENFSDAFNDASTATFDGLRYIISEVNKGLKSFDAKPVKVSFDAPSGGKKPRKAASGWVGLPGERGDDQEHVVVGRGEAILNHQQQQYVNESLQKDRGHSFGDMFKRLDGRHGASSPGGYATGKASSINWGGKPPLTGGIAKAVGAIESKFPGISVTSTTGGGHAANSYHYKGLAVDLGGAVDTMRAAAQWIKTTMGSSLTEGIHNPNLSIKNGKSVPSSFWGGATWGAHGNHIHLAIAGALSKLKGMTDATVSQIKTKVDGHGALADLVGKALDGTASKANKKLSDAVASANDDAGGGDLSGFSGGGNSRANQALGRKMMLAFGYPASEWPSLKQLWTGESGWDDKIVNKSSGAGGIPQALPATKMGPKGAGESPSTQIAWGLKYIKGRYGSPSKALSFWNSKNPHWYTKGGILPSFDVGGIIPGAEGAPQPILAHGREWILNRKQQGLAAAMAGMTPDGLKNKLGFSGGPTSYARGGAIRTVKQVDRIGDSALAGTNALEGIMRRVPKSVGSKDRSRIESAVKKRIIEFYKDYADRIEAQTSEINQQARGIKGNPNIATRKFLDYANSFKNFSRGAEKTVAAIAQQLDLITQDGSFFENITNQIEAATAEAARKIQNSTYTYTQKIKGKIVTRVGRSDRNINADESLPDAISRITQQGAIDVRDLTATRGQTARARTGVNSLLATARRTARQTGMDYSGFSKKTLQRLARRRNISSKGSASSIEARLQDADSSAISLGDFDRQADAIIDVQTKALQKKFKGNKKKIDSEVAKLKKKVDGKKSKDNKAAAQRLQKSINALTDERDKLNQSMADNAQAIVERQEQQAADIFDATSKRFDRRNTLIGNQINAATIHGDLRGAAGLVDSQIASANDEKGQLQDQLRSAEKSGNRDLAEQIRDRITTLDDTVLQLGQQKIQAITNAISGEAEQRNSGIDMRGRIANAMGNLDAIPGNIAEMVASNTKQVNELAAAKAQAIASGQGAEADRIQQEINGLNASIVEGIGSIIAANVAAIDARFGKMQGDAQFRQALAERGLTDMGMGLDNSQIAGQQLNSAQIGRTNYGAVDSSLRDQNSLLRGQEWDLIQQYNSAIAQGFTGEADELRKRIQDLDVQIVDNIKATRDNTDARLADAAQRRTANSDFMLSLNQSASSIGQQIATLNSQDFNPMAQALAAQRQNYLLNSQAGAKLNLTDLLSQLGAGTGFISQINSASGNDLAPLLTNLYTSIKDNTNISDSEMDSIKGYITAILSNEEAITENSNAIKNLSGQMSQAFTSTAWTTFRQAIFDGSGGLLAPYAQQYAIGTMTGSVSSAGLSSNGNTSVKNSTVNKRGTNIENFNLNVTNPTEVLDTDTVMEQAAFKINSIGRQ